MKSEPIASVPRSEYVPTADQRIVMSGVTWEAFEALLAARGDSGPRVAYLRGTLELMSPSSDHEIITNYFAETVQAHLDHHEIVYQGVGSWLLKHAPGEAGLEPDACYILHAAQKPRPDLALEVIWTSGGIGKLEIYRRLGVGEVWFWNDGRVSIHVLTSGGYEERTKSACLPGFDFALLAEVMELSTLSEVRKVLRSRLPPR